MNQNNATWKVRKCEHTFVDVRGVGFLAGLRALLLVTGGSGLLASFLLLSWGLGGGGLAGGLLLCGGFGRHFDGFWDLRRKSRERICMMLMNVDEVEWLMGVGCWRR
jgi:hypothetical protein